MRFFRTFILTIAALLIGNALAFASNHDKAIVNTKSGIPLAALKHEQILPIYNNYAAIIKLARSVDADATWTSTDHDAFTEVLSFTDTTYSKAARFNNLAATWLFGDVLTVDTNPGHLPTHAALRGAMDLLDRMQKAHGADPAISALFTKVNDAMYGLMGTCAYSNTPFNTNDVVHADWSHQSLKLLGSGLFAVLMAAAMFNVLIVRRRATPLPYIGQRHFA